MTHAPSIPMSSTSETVSEKLVADAANPKQGQVRFSDLGLPPSLLGNLTSMGFENPTDIQSTAIPAMLSGRDLLGIAQTGTGKTAAFALPILSGIDPSRRVTQALVLVPTRELALQVAEAIEQFARPEPDVQIVAVYGGAPWYPQKKALDAGAQIVVGTPGRVMDHLDRGTLNLDAVQFVVLDEGDEMLRMGFAEDVDQILSHAPSERQTALFSATMPRAIAETARRHMVDPQRIEASRPSTTVNEITQRYAVVPARHRIGALTRLLETSSADAAIVFVRTRAAAEEVGVALVSEGISAAAISGDVAQAEREKLVERLRSGKLNVLVATDVAARGLDVERIGLVVNFDLPRETDSYVHRIGRTGRAGRSGEAFSFVGPKEVFRLKQIERATRTKMIETDIPTPAQVAKHRLGRTLSSVSSRLELGRLDYAREAVQAAVDAGADPMDLATALAAIAAGDDGVWIAQEKESRQRREAERSARGDRDERRSGQGFSRDSNSRSSREDSRGPGKAHHKGSGRKYWIGVGLVDGAAAGAIVGAITNEGGLQGSDLGRIEMFGRFSLVEILPELSAGDLRRIGSARVSGRPLRIRLDQAGSQPQSGSHRDKPRGRSESRAHSTGAGQHGHGGVRHGRDSGRRGYSADRPHKARESDRTHSRVKY